MEGCGDEGGSDGRSKYKGLQTGVQTNDRGFFSGFFASGVQSHFSFLFPPLKTGLGQGQLATGAHRMGIPFCFEQGRNGMARRGEAGHGRDEVGYRDRDGDGDGDEGVGMRAWTGSCCHHAYLIFSGLFPSSNGKPAFPHHVSTSALVVETLSVPTASPRLLSHPSPTYIGFLFICGVFPPLPPPYLPCYPFRLVASSLPPCATHEYNVSAYIYIYIHTYRAYTHTNTFKIPDNWLGSGSVR